MKIVIKKFIFNIITNIININLFFLKNKKYYYSSLNSFGDTFEYYLKYYSKFKRKKILVFSNIDRNIVEFLYGKKSFIKIFSFVNYIPTYEIFIRLKNKKFFLPYKSNYNDISDHMIRKKDLKISRKILKNKIILNKNIITPSVKKLKDTKYIVMHIKHFHNNINNIKFSSSRQTSHLNKIFRVINYIKKDYNLVILGIKSDKSLKILQTKYEGKKNIFFLNDISKNYSIDDQMFCYYHSSGYIGSSAGMFPILWVLNKKIIVFDLFKEETDNRFKSNNFSILYKRYFLRKNKKIKILDEKILSKLKENKYKIIEVSSKKIIKKYRSFFCQN